MKNKLSLQFGEAAGDEIIEAYVWYEEQLTGLGDQFLQTLNAFEVIKRSPDAFTVCDNHRQYPLKKFPFVLLYEVSDDIIYIDAIIHTRRDPTRKKQIVLIRQ